MQNYLNRKRKGEKNSLYGDLNDARCFICHPEAVVGLYAYQPYDVISAAQHVLPLALESVDFPIGKHVTHQLHPFHSEGHEAVACLCSSHGERGREQVCVAVYPLVAERSHRFHGLHDDARFARHFVCPFLFPRQTPSVQRDAMSPRLP